MSRTYLLRISVGLLLGVAVGIAIEHTALPRGGEQLADGGVHEHMTKHADMPSTNFTAALALISGGKCVDAQGKDISNEPTRCCNIAFAQMQVVSCKEERICYLGDFDWTEKLRAWMYGWFTPYVVKMKDTTPDTLTNGGTTAKLSPAGTGKYTATLNGLGYTVLATGSKPTALIHSNKVSAPLSLAPSGDYSTDPYPPTPSGYTFAIDGRVIKLDSTMPDGSLKYVDLGKTYIVKPGTNGPTLKVNGTPVTLVNLKSSIGTNIEYVPGVYGNGPKAPIQYVVITPDACPEIKCSACQSVKYYWDAENVTCNATYTSIEGAPPKKPAPLNAKLYDTHKACEDDHPYEVCRESPAENTKYKYNSESELVEEEEEETETPCNCAKLIEKKDVKNPNGGTKQAKNFTLHVKKDGEDIKEGDPTSPQPGSTTGVEYHLQAGEFTIDEDTVPGYQLNLIRCEFVDKDGKKDSQETNTKSLRLKLKIGDTVTCTFYNEDKPKEETSLVVKTLVYNSYGKTDEPKDFLTYVKGDDGKNVDGSPKPGTAQGQTYAIAPGATVKVGEDLRKGYELTSFKVETPDGKTTTSSSGFGNYKTVTLKSGKTTVTLVNRDLKKEFQEDVWDISKKKSGTIVVIKKLKTETAKTSDFKFELSKTKTVTQTQTAPPKSETGQQYTVAVDLQKYCCVPNGQRAGCDAYSDACANYADQGAYVVKAVNKASCDSFCKDPYSPTYCCTSATSCEMDTGSKCGKNPLYYTDKCDSKCLPPPPKPAAPAPAPTPPADPSVKTVASNEEIPWEEGDVYITEKSSTVAVSNYKQTWSSNCPDGKAKVVAGKKTVCELINEDWEEWAWSRKRESKSTASTKCGWLLIIKKVDKDAKANDFVYEVNEAQYKVATDKPTQAPPKEYEVNTVLYKASPIPSEPYCCLESQQQCQGDGTVARAQDICDNYGMGGSLATVLYSRDQATCTESCKKKPLATYCCTKDGPLKNDGTNCSGKNLYDSEQAYGNCPKPAPNPAPAAAPATDAQPNTTGKGIYVPPGVKKEMSQGDYIASERSANSNVSVSDYDLTSPDCPGGKFKIVCGKVTICTFINKKRSGSARTAKSESRESSASWKRAWGTFSGVRSRGGPDTSGKRGYQGNNGSPKSGVKGSPKYGGNGSPKSGVKGSPRSGGGSGSPKSGGSGSPGPGSGGSKSPGPGSGGTGSPGPGGGTGSPGPGSGESGSPGPGVETKTKGMPSDTTFTGGLGTFTVSPGQPSTSTPTPGTFTIWPTGLPENVQVKDIQVEENFPNSTIDRDTNTTTINYQQGEHVTVTYVFGPQLASVATTHPAAGQTGPGAVAVMAAGAAAGYSWVKRRRRKN